MACTDCFNGCAGSINPDKCVKYTGVDRPEFDIKNGDSLFSVEDNIILKILDMIIGEAILPTINASNVCDLIMGNLPPVGPHSLNEYLTAVIKSVCTQQTDLEIVIDKVSEINSDYDLGDCITGVDVEDVHLTHLVLQATIDTLCELKSDFDALVITLPTTYVAIEDINDYIEAYIESALPASLISNKMIPFVAVEYYGPLSHFDASGSGIGDWAKVYLCNGAHGTPDKRGRVAVGVTAVAGGGAYNPSVDPANPDNPNYTLNTPIGSNTVVLSSAQLPPHTHVATAVVVDPGHNHNIVASGHNAAAAGSEWTLNSNPGAQNYSTDSGKTNVTVNVTNANTGQGKSHSNVQPVLPCHYIMYIP